MGYFPDVTLSSFTDYSTSASSSPFLSSSFTEDSTSASIPTSHRVRLRYVAPTYAPRFRTGLGRREQDALFATYLAEDSLFGDDAYALRTSRRWDRRTGGLARLYHPQTSFCWRGTDGFRRLAGRLEVRRHAQDCFRNTRPL